MATVTGFTAERMLEIENETVVSGLVDVNGDLLLYTREGTEINAGHVKGDPGDDATVPDASETVKGKAEIATSAEVITGTDNTRMVTPAGLAALTSTETRRGLIELATSAEIRAATDTVRGISPAGLRSIIGLELINRYDFSAVTSVSMSPIFSAKYDGYFVHGKYTRTAGGTRARLRSGGSDSSVAGYRYQRTASNSTSTTGSQATGDTGWFFNGNPSAATWEWFTLELESPFLTEVTTGILGCGLHNNTTGNMYHAAASLLQNQATSYDGLTVYQDSGTMTGFIEVYGFMKKV